MRRGRCDRREAGSVMWRRWRRRGGDQQNGAGKSNLFFIPLLRWNVIYHTMQCNFVASPVSQKMKDTAIKDAQREESAAGDATGTRLRRDNPNRVWNSRLALSPPVYCRCFTQHRFTGPALKTNGRDADSENFMGFFSWCYTFQPGERNVVTQMNDSVNTRRDRCTR